MDNLEKIENLARRNRAKFVILVESRSWRDRNLKFGPQIMIWRWIIWREQIKNYPPPDYNLGQILNSDPASSYFPLKFADLLKLKYFLHP